ncbi:MAG: phage portal protein [Magnetococcales bacterium]|nr:phage portal protein [Magnetococcales bacterium]
MVTAESAMRLSAVYACVRILAETMATLPFILYRQRPDGGKDRITDHWLYSLIARRPNAFQNAFEWREMLMGHLTLRGNAYNRIISGKNGKILQLQPIHPDRIKVNVKANGDYFYTIFDLEGRSMDVPRHEVWHLRGLSSDGIMGVSPIGMARESLGAALAAQEYSSRFFANDAKPGGGWIEFPGTFKDAEARRVFRETMQAAQSGANRGKTMVLDNGMKYHEVGITNRDAQFLEFRQFLITDVARLFRVPPHMIGDLTRSSFSNITQQSLDFVTNTMRPWAERWEAGIESDLLLEEDDLEVEFDFFQMLRGDEKSRADFYHLGITDGWMNRNEARVRENMNPVPELDQFLRPNKMGPGSAGDPQDDPQQNQGADDIQEDTKNKNNIIPDSAVDTDRVNAIVMGVIGRIARKEVAALRRELDRGADLPSALATAYRKHAQYVTDSLAIPIEEAEGYCTKISDDLSSDPAALAWHETIAIKRLSDLGKTYENWAPPR